MGGFQTVSLTSETSETIAVWRDSIFVSVNSVCSSLLFFIEESKIIRRCVVSSPSILHILTKILNIPEIDHPTQPKGACSLSLKTPSTQ